MTRSRSCWAASLAARLVQAPGIDNFLLPRPVNIDFSNAAAFIMAVAGLLNLALVKHAGEASRQDGAAVKAFSAALAFSAMNARAADEPCDDNLGGATPAPAWAGAPAPAAIRSQDP
jgi:hypothetical protein